MHTPGSMVSLESEILPDRFLSEVEGKITLSDDPADSSNAQKPALVDTSGESFQGSSSGSHLLDHKYVRYKRARLGSPLRGSQITRTMVFSLRRVGIQHTVDESSFSSTDFIGTTCQRTKSTTTPRQQRSSLISTKTRGHSQQKASKGGRTDNALGREKTIVSQSNLSLGQGALNQYFFYFSHVGANTKATTFKVSYKF